MSPNHTRRALLGALLAGGTGAAALSPADSFLRRLAPLSGRTWREARVTPGATESPYGPATVTYDDRHVPHVAADDEAAAYYAAGFVQAADRLLQMDLFRRRARGTLAAAVGEAGVESDVFHAKMDFEGAAEATRERVEGTEAGHLAQAFADGVTAYIEDHPPGVGFGLLEYEPDRWRVTDSALIATEMSWLLTGSFETLRRAVARRALDEDLYRTLYPYRLDHDAPIIRPGKTGGEIRGMAGRTANKVSTPPAGDTLRGAADPDFVGWLSQFESRRDVGSNAWVVSGEYTDSGAPVVCNDPHLPLSAPPIWYQIHYEIGDRRVAGATLPGSPFVVIGENDHGAWGVTNVGADVLDLYTYETDGDRYRYRGEWRAFEAETRTVAVAGGEDREVAVRKTVHGPFLDREVNGQRRHVGVAWTGLTGTGIFEALLGWNRSTGRESFRAATRSFDAPTQNVHYADADGHTLYQLAGKIPIRRIDGEVVRGDRVFDGSAGEAEWEGYEPYGQSSWDGFVPFEEKPAVIDPDYVASANQRTLDDPAYPIAQSFSAGLRGSRIYERLDRAADRGTTMDRAFLRSIQLDTVDLRARALVPGILAARDRMPDRADPWLDALADWDYRMDRDAEAALAFDRCYRHFHERTWRPFLEAHGIGGLAPPGDRVTVSLPADSPVFDGDRAAVLAAAMGDAVDEIESEGWETYGDYNVTAIDHSLGSVVTGLNYPRYPTDGSGKTVRAFSPAGFGASYRLLGDLGGESRDVIPGGNDGRPFGDSYADQLRSYADGEYRRLGGGPAGEPDVTVRGTRDE
ncbi:MAG: penicillin acylase family protein [Haloarculaceae archaeon]